MIYHMGMRQVSVFLGSSLRLRGKAPARRLLLEAVRCDCDLQEITAGPEAQQLAAFFGRESVEARVDMWEREMV